jgi:hypothetical protein
LGIIGEEGPLNRYLENPTVRYIKRRTGTFAQFGVVLPAKKKSIVMVEKTKGSGKK